MSRWEPYSSYGYRLVDEDGRIVGTCDKFDDPEWIASYERRHVGKYVSQDTCKAAVENAHKEASK